MRLECFVWWRVLGGETHESEITLYDNSARGSGHENLDAIFAVTGTDRCPGEADSAHVS